MTQKLAAGHTHQQPEKTDLKRHVSNSKRHHSISAHSGTTHDNAHSGTTHDSAHSGVTAATRVQQWSQQHHSQQLEVHLPRSPSTDEWAHMTWHETHNGLFLGHREGTRF